MTRILLLTSISYHLVNHPWAKYFMCFHLYVFANNSCCVVQFSLSSRVILSSPPNIPFRLDPDGFPIDFIFTFMTFKTSAPIITVLFFLLIHQLSSFQCDTRIQDTMHIKSQNVKIWQNPCKHNIFDIILIPGFSILTDWAGVLCHYSVMQKTALIFFLIFFSHPFFPTKIGVLRIWVQLIIWIRRIFIGRDAFIKMP